MEDDSKGWEIQEYSASGEPDENNKVTLRKIVKGGLRIGKTVFVTGVVISSAPFILPPLMVVSAVGLVCSVPFGVFVVSYTCAEKLMSKLLPMPKPPPPLPLMLEYKGNEVGYNFDSLSDAYDVYDDDESEEDSFVIRETDIELDSKFPLQMNEDVDVEEEEENLFEDTKGNIEMRISLPTGEETENVSEDKYYDRMASEEEHPVENDETSAEQDEQLTAVSKTEISGIEIHPVVEILRQERPVDNVNIEDSNTAQKTHEDIACSVVEVEGPYGLTIGAVEQIAPVKESGDPYQAKQSMTINPEESSKHKKPTSNTKEDCISQFTAKHGAIKTDDVHSNEVGGGIEMSGDIKTAICTPDEETMKTSEHELTNKTDNKSEQGINIDPLNVELVGETPFMQKDDLEKQHVLADATSTTKRKKKAKKKKPTTEVTALQTHSADQEGAISSTADDEGRLNLVGDTKAGEETHANKTIVDQVQPTESGTTTSRTPSGQSLKASQKKVIFSEEKIWENIEALRTIVGYRVARHNSCMEELKALYIFTGVEQPMSFKSSPDVTDSPDLDDVDDKLRFLMAIVGVK